MARARFSHEDRLPPAIGEAVATTSTPSPNHPPEGIVVNPPIPASLNPGHLPESPRQSTIHSPSDDTYAAVQDPPIPRALRELTSQELGRLVRSLADDGDGPDEVIISDITYEEYRDWQSAIAPEVFSEYGAREFTILRRSVIFRPASGDAGIGDLIIKCAPGPYHDSVFRVVAKEAEKAICRAINSNDSGLTFSNSEEFFLFTPTSSHPAITPGMVKIPDGAIYPTPRLDDASCRSTTFPTFVLEVGFSQKLSGLVQDALLYLQCTGNTTQVVALVELVEKKERVKQWSWPTAISNEDAAETASHSQPPSNPPPALANNPSKAAQMNAIRQLQSYCFETDVRHVLRPPLVGPLNAILHVYRRNPDTDGDTSADIVCEKSVKFIEADKPIAGANITFSLTDIYGSEGPSTFGEAAKDTEIELDLEIVGKEILSRKIAMMQKRAAGRARRMVDAVLKRQVEEKRVMDDELENASGRESSVASEGEGDRGGGSVLPMRTLRPVETRRRRRRRSSLPEVEPVEMVPWQKIKRQKMASDDSYEDVEDQDAETEEGSENS